MDTGKSPIRITPTHSGIDSRGVMKVPLLGELEGSSYIVLLGGVFASLVFFMLLMVTKIHFLFKFFLAIQPLVGSIVWQICMVRGKPPGYQIDFFERLLDGRDFFLKPLPWSKRPHPLSVQANSKSHG